MRRYGASIQHAETVKLSKVADTSTTILRRDMSFVDALKAMVNSSGAFKLEYNVKFVDSGTKYIVDDKKSSDYLSTRSRETYSRNVRFAKLVIKNKEILDPLEALSSELTSGKLLGISQVGSLVSNCQSPTTRFCWSRRPILRHRPN